MADPNVGTCLTKSTAKDKSKQQQQPLRQDRGQVEPRGGRGRGRPRRKLEETHIHFQRRGQQGDRGGHGGQLAARYPNPHSNGHPCLKPDQDLQPHRRQQVQQRQRRLHRGRDAHGVLPMALLPLFWLILMLFCAATEVTYPSSSSAMAFINAQIVRMNFIAALSVLDFTIFF